jgi:hypothetical protein
MARKTRDGTNAAVVLMGMMACGLLGGPLLALTTKLSATAAIGLGTVIPVVLAVVLHARALLRGNRMLAARLSTEAELQRALKGQAEGAPAAPGLPDRIPLRGATLAVLACLSLVVQGTVGGVLSALVLGGLWAALLSPALRRKLAAHLPHGETQIGLVQARSDTVSGMRLSVHRSGRSSSGSERQSRQDQRQVGSSTTRA